MNEQQQQEHGMEGMGVLAHQHELFKPFVGTFRAEVKLWMGPGDPMVSTGTMLNELDLDGRFLKETYTGDELEPPYPAFAGRGFWGYNTASKQFEGFWIDNASTVMQTEVGNVDDTGKVWTMLGEVPNPPGGGPPLKKRSVITLIDDDHHSMEMYFTGPDGNEAKAMEIQYARA